MDFDIDAAKSKYSELDIYELQDIIIMRGEELDNLRALNKLEDMEYACADYSEMIKSKIINKLIEFECEINSLKEAEPVGPTKDERIATMEAEKAAADERIATMEAEKAAAEERIAAMEAEKTAADERMLQLEQQLEEATAKLKNQPPVQSIAIIENDLKRKLTAETNKCNQLHNELEMLQRELMRLKGTSTQAIAPERAPKQFAPVQYQPIGGIFQ